MSRNESKQRSGFHVSLPCPVRSTRLVCHRTVLHLVVRVNIPTESNILSCARTRLTCHIKSRSRRSEVRRCTLHCTTFSVGAQTIPLKWRQCQVTAVKLWIELSKALLYTKARTIVCFLSELVPITRNGIVDAGCRNIRRRRVTEFVYGGI